MFFVQDAIKFPDLIHAVKEEPDRGFPQAQSAHDTFWGLHLADARVDAHGDVADVRPHHPALVAHDGRLRCSQLRLVDSAGKSTYVKFHWRPKLGSQSVVWDEALKINGADPDYHRRDLWNAIDKGSFPEWELSVQAFDEAFAKRFDFDVLDATKLIPRR